MAKEISLGPLTRALHVLLSAGDKDVFRPLPSLPSLPSADKVPADKVCSATACCAALHPILRSSVLQFSPIQLAKARKFFLAMLRAPEAPKPRVSRWDRNEGSNGGSAEDSKASTSASAAPTPSVNAWAVPASQDSFLPGSPLACAALCFAWLEYLTSGLTAACRVFDEHILRYAIRVQPQAQDAANAKSARPFDDKTEERRASRGGRHKAATADDVARSADNSELLAQSEADIAWGYPSGSLQHEWLLAAYVRLLAGHAAVHSTPPRLLRDLVTRALKASSSSSFMASS